MQTMITILKKTNNNYNIGNNNKTILIKLRNKEDFLLNLPKG